jgi:hypothetical protein
MKQGKDYIQDIAEIRSMMERSSKFLSLSGWAGIMAGVYALAGAYLAYFVFHFQPDAIFYQTSGRNSLPADFLPILFLAIAVLVLSVGTAVILSARKATKNGEKIWNATSRRLLVTTAVPLAAGGILILLLIMKGMTGLAAPLSLIFYGLALFSASKFTYVDVRSLGLIQVVLGLAGSWFVEWSVLFWAAGFGMAHILYGIYIYYKYER